MLLDFLIYVGVVNYDDLYKWVKGYRGKDCLVDLLKGCLLKLSGLW